MHSDLKSDRQNFRIILEFLKFFVCLVYYFIKNTLKSTIWEFIWKPIIKTYVFPLMKFKSENSVFTEYLYEEKKYCDIDT